MSNTVQGLLLMQGKRKKFRYIGDVNDEDDFHFLSYV